VGRLRFCPGCASALPPGANLPFLVALFTALAGTWWLALALGSLSTDLPIISFDPAPVLLLLGWMLIVALPPAILANLLVLTDHAG